MRRRALISTMLAAVATSLVLCPSAGAAVSLSFSEVSREPAAVASNDEYADYLVKVKNTGDEVTTGTVTVSLALPSGLHLNKASGSGWSCSTATLSCTRAASIAAGAEAPQLKFEVWIYPDLAPPTVNAEFTASGGGSGGAASATDVLVLEPAIPFDFIDLKAGAFDDDGDPHTQAGGHPFRATSSFSFTTHTTPDRNRTPVESLRDLFLELPPGFIGNPENGAGVCTVPEVKATSNFGVVCPEAAVVGGIGIDAPASGFFDQTEPIYRVVPEEGFVAAFAAKPIDQSTLTIVIRVRLRSNGDYGVTAVSPLPPQWPELAGVNFATLCGFGAKTTPGSFQPKFAGCKEPTDPGAWSSPFLTNQTKCAGGEPSTAGIMDSFQNVGGLNAEGFPDRSDPAWKSREAKSPEITGCEPLTEAWVGQGPSPTKPSFEFDTTTTRAAAPAAYSARLHIPQEGLLDHDGLATSHLKNTTVTLPRGLALNPSAAAGLGACSEAQIGLVSKHPVRFNTTSEGCPQDSKLGTVRVSTPVLDKPLKGAVFLAAQDHNALDARFAIYLVIEDRETGVVAKLAGKVEPSNSEEGRITATFLDNPQVPVEDLEVSFFDGDRASLANPDVCGAYTTRTELTPWSAADPEAPLPSEIAVSEDSVAIDAPPAGQAACPATKAQRPFNLGFSAGSANPLAGAYSPFTLRMTRPDGNQELDQVIVSTPPGFLAALRGVAICPEGALAVALAKSGKQELASPSCPAASQVGTTTIGAGAGPQPFYVKTGRIYLTGPYKGGPASLAFVVPAVAGPFDLGVQVVRTALQIDPRTGQVTAKADPIPKILDGVPLQVRDVRVDLDRPSFALNPTSCEPMAIKAQVSGASGALANLDSRFQVGGCEKLAFKPNLKIQLHGGTRRAAYQRLEATVTYPGGSGYANIARAAVTLPHSSFLAQEHIRTVCTRVQFAAKACPAGSIYGHATAITPLLDQPLTGPVYLRSSSNPLPDLVAALRGPDAQPVEVEVAGRTDSKGGGIRNTFDLVPDAPVSRFDLKLFGGKKSLIVNSRDLCKGRKQLATVRLKAHNGMTRNFRTAVGNDCGRKKGKKGAKRR